MMVLLKDVFFETFNTEFRHEQHSLAASAYLNKKMFHVISCFNSFNTTSNLLNIKCIRSYVILSDTKNQKLRWGWGDNFIPPPPIGFPLITQKR